MRWFGLKLASVVILLGGMPIVYAVPFANGGFSSGLTNWNTLGDVSVIGGAAQLSTTVGTDPFSASLIQGDDGTFSFANPITLGATDNFLVFEVQFVDLGTDTAETVGSFTDNLSVALFDRLDPLLDLVFSSVAGLAGGGPQVVLDVRSLVGRAVALSFDLADENDGRDSRVVIDNVLFVEAVPAAVPAPATTLLLLGGLSLLAGSRCRHS